MGVLIYTGATVILYQQQFDSKFFCLLNSGESFCQQKFVKKCSDHRWDLYRKERIEYAISIIFTSYFKLFFFSDVSFYLDELGGYLDFENPSDQVQRINCTLEIPEKYEVYITEFSSKLVQPDNFVLLDRKQITEHRFQTISQGQRDIFEGMNSLENFKTQRLYEKMGNLDS